MYFRINRLLYSVCGVMCVCIMSMHLLSTGLERNSNHAVEVKNFQQKQQETVILNDNDSKNISVDAIKMEKQKTMTKKPEANSTSNICPPISPTLRGSLGIDIVAKSELRRVDGSLTNWPPTFEELAIKYNKKLQLGGFYPGPKECKCRSYNAIIVPYRDREEHLRYFLHYIHDILQRQQLCYVIIVSEQADNNIFNKGQLMNTAFEYARALMSFDCYIFHDVDMIPEDDRILYNCTNDSPVHYAPFIDKYDYKYVKDLTVGGAVGYTKDMFVALNGYSNEYAGWGGEDDDMYERIKNKNISIWRPTEDYYKFSMIRHGKDERNGLNEHRYTRLKVAKSRMVLDGLNTLDTELVDNLHYKTHTRLKVKTYKTPLQRQIDKMKPSHGFTSRLNIRPVVDKVSGKELAKLISYGRSGIPIITRRKPK